MLLWVLAPCAAVEWGTSAVPTAPCSSLPRGNGFSKAKPQGNSQPWRWRRLYPSQEPGCEAARPRVSKHREAVELLHCLLSCGDLGWPWQSWQRWSSRDPGD